MTKYKEPFDDLNPSVKIHVKPLRGLSAAEPIKILSIVSGPISKAYPDFEFVTKPKEIELAGLKAAYMCVKYNLAISDGRTYPTRSELWVVPHGKMFFLIGTGVRQDEKTGKRDEIQAIIESIKINSTSSTKRAGDR